LHTVLSEDIRRFTGNHQINIRMLMSSYRNKNQLLHASSPYLQLHAHDPVHWQPWNDNTLQQIAAEQKPVLVSIGYASCDWCRRMQRETYQNLAVAELLNQHFICIKVDRNERPDIDHIYMLGIQMMTGSNGWPMTLFLTPELLPFYGGMYFPPDDQGELPGFRRILEVIIRKYDQSPDQIAEVAQRLSEHIAEVSCVTVSHRLPTQTVLDTAYKFFSQHFDEKFGGFAESPKFPPVIALSFLLRYWRSTREKHALEQVRHTLQHMTAGGIFDHIGGGFHRYALDARWRTPQFEKLLCDNAQLASIYLEAYQATRDTGFREVCIATLEYVQREMQHPLGGFYTSQDSGEFGDYYLWSRSDILDILGSHDGDTFCELYHVTDTGNVSRGNNVLFVSETTFETPGNAAYWMEPHLGWRKTLREARESKGIPVRDETILMSWNGLMLSVLSRASQILDIPHYLATANQTADFMTSYMFRNGRLMATWRQDTEQVPGYLDDSAYLLQGFLDLYEATGDIHRLQAAITLADDTLDRFWDAQAGACCLTAGDHESLFTRCFAGFDSSLPSGNAVLAHGLLRLARMLESARYRQQGEQILKTYHVEMNLNPAGYTQMLCVADFLLNPGPDMIIIGEDMQHVNDCIHSRFVPNKVLLPSSPCAVHGHPSPLVQGRQCCDNQTTVFLRNDQTSPSPPITSLQDLIPWLP
jgi:uncharacterized protein